jgi:hypothetical protein
MALTLDQVRTIYLNVLNRPATDAEAQSWVNVNAANILTDQQVRDAIINSNEATNFVDPIVRLYQAAFGRVPDKVGFDANVDGFARGGLSLQQIGTIFSSSTEFTGRYGTTVTEAYVQALYVNVLGRLGQPGEVLAWVNSGQSMAQILIGFSQSQEFVSRSATAIDTFLNAAAQNTATYQGPLLDAGAGTGTTYTLATGPDNIPGTAGADTINAFIDTATAANSTFTGADTINGLGGNDTLVLTVDGNGAGALPGATISNVEIFSIREVGGTAGTYDFGTVVGETSIINNRSTDAVTFNNLAASTTLTIKGDGTTVNGNTTFKMAAATDAVTINIDGGTTGGNVTRDATGAATIVVNSTGAANKLGTLDLDNAATTVKGLTINAATNLEVNLAADFAASSVITLTGIAAKVDLDGAALSANISKVDASAMSVGGVFVKVDQTDATVDTQFIGGKGADIFDVGKVVYSDAAKTAAGGDGIDTIRMTDQAALTTATAKNISGFESLSLFDDDDGALDTFDASLLTGLTSFVLNADSAGDGYSITNLTAAQAAAITIAATQAVGPTFGVKDATVVGNLDSLTLTFDDAAAAVNTLTVADLNAAGVETIKLVATDNIVVTAATGLTALTNLTVTGAGTSSITTGALALNVNTVFDASAATGAFTFVGTAATTNGAAIKGSATKDNTITGTNQNDVITGGTGKDTVKNQADAATDADTIDFVSDSAVDTFEITTITGKSTITNFDVATTTTTEDLVNASENTIDGGEVVITTAAAQGAITTDRTYVIEQTVGTAGSLTTGGTQVLAAADFTAATLTNVAAFLTERFTTVATDTALVVLNNGTNTYAYYVNEGALDAGIQAAEVTLLAVFNGAVLNNGDIFQTV